MMNKPMIRIHDLASGEIVDREMTDEEFEIYQEDVQRENDRISSEQQKAARRAEILERLGLTQDEAEILLS